MMHGKKLIIWDWNGTLLNDIDACIESMNTMLKRRSMELIDKDTYLRIFTFPVQKYYETIGFNFYRESFEQLSVEYISLYKKGAVNSALQPGVVEALEQFTNKGLTQVVLSASEQVSLENQVEQHQLQHYFDALIGLNNIYAKSKLENAIHYLENSSILPNETLLIGDTFHDYEVAKAIGCDCLLVNNGHQNLSQYNLNHEMIINSLRDILNTAEFKPANKDIINKNS